MSFWKSQRNDATWWGVGLGTGVAIGVALHQLALWTAIGCCMAAAMQMAARRRRASNR